MKTNHLLSTCIFALTAAAVATPTASAAGLVGQRSLGVIYGATLYESDAYRTSSNLSAFYRQPVSDWVDLNLDYRVRDRRSDRMGLPDGSRETTMLSACFIGKAEEATPFLRVGLGWGEDDYGYRTGDGAIYAVGIGAEFIAFGNVSATPFLEWTDAFREEDVDGVLTYGMDVAVDLSSRFSMLVRVEGDDHYNWTGGLGIALRF